MQAGNAMQCWSCGWTHPLTQKSPVSHGPFPLHESRQTFTINSLVCPPAPVRARLCRLARCQSHAHRPAATRIGTSSRIWFEAYDITLGAPPSEMGYASGLRSCLCTLLVLISLRVAPPINPYLTWLRSLSSFSSSVFPSLSLAIWSCSSSSCNHIHASWNNQPTNQFPPLLLPLLPPLLLLLQQQLLLPTKQRRRKVRRHVPDERGGGRDWGLPLRPAGHL